MLMLNEADNIASNNVIICNFFMIFLAKLMQQLLATSETFKTKEREKEIMEYFVLYLRAFSL